MKVELLFFAAVRDLVGRDSEVIDLPDTVETIADLATFLAQHHPPLDGRLASVRFARNETFATNDEVLADGDVIALIPPVAGG
jgi:molybdopterin synthase sulfur carrier subunit